jgi:hypothetical protein
MVEKRNSGIVLTAEAARKKGYKKCTRRVSFDDPRGVWIEGDENKTQGSLCYIGPCWQDGSGTRPVCYLDENGACEDCYDEPDRVCD